MFCAGSTKTPVLAMNGSRSGSAETSSRGGAAPVWISVRGTLCWGWTLADCAMPSGPKAVARRSQRLIGGVVPLLRSAQAFTRTRLRSMGSSQGSGFPAAIAASIRSAPVRSGGGDQEGIRSSVRRAYPPVPSKAGASQIHCATSVDTEGDQIVNTNQCRSANAPAIFSAWMLPDPAAAQHGDPQHRCPPLDVLRNLCCSTLALSMTIP